MAFGIAADRLDPTDFGQSADISSFDRDILTAIKLTLDKCPNSRIVHLPGGGRVSFDKDGHITEVAVGREYHEYPPLHEDDLAIGNEERYKHLPKLVCQKRKVLFVHLDVEDGNYSAEALAVFRLAGPIIELSSDCDELGHDDLLRLLAHLQRQGETFSKLVTVDLPWLSISASSLGNLFGRFAFVKLRELTICQRFVAGGDQPIAVDDLPRIIGILDDHLPLLETLRIGLRWTQGPADRFTSWDLTAYNIRLESLRVDLDQPPPASEGILDLVMQLAAISMEEYSTSVRFMARDNFRRLLPPHLQGIYTVSCVSRR